MPKPKTRPIKAIPVPDSNPTKYFSYKEAWGRISRAIGHGFFFEAVTIEESIMCDRLISYLCRVHVKADANLERQSFANLIALWKKQVPYADRSSSSNWLRISASVGFGPSLFGHRSGGGFEKTGSSRVITSAQFFWIASSSFAFAAC
jgi:hypothetical protein